MEWLEEPVKVWPLVVFAIAFGITLHKMEKQMSAIGKCAYEVWEKMHPSPYDEV